VPRPLPRECGSACSSEFIPVERGAIMPNAKRPVTLVELARQPGIGDVIVEHAFRGARVQRVLRLLLAVFLAAALAFVPPDDDLGLCWLIVTCYAVWSVVVSVLVRYGGRGTLRYLWLAVFVDVFALGALTLVAADDNPLTWTPYLLINGFFVLPVIAATQLTPGVGAAAIGPAVVVYLLAGALTREDDSEPIASLLLRTALLGVVGLGAVLLSRVQRSRVLTIGQLAGERSALVAELLTMERREQKDLAEALHDGALQYVLAARQELDDVRDSAHPESIKRIDFALAESSRLLRSTMAQLHPAVLQLAGLPAALHDLVTTTESRGRLRIDLDVSGWPPEARTSADELLLTTARELLVNVVKHADADRAEIRLALDGETARLQVSDNGKGMAGVDLNQRLAEKHLGVASRRIRLEAAGGSLHFRNAEPHGTIAEVEVPTVSELTPAAAS
jgi:two-component system, NarL family, sensor kinase